MIKKNYAEHAELGHAIYKVVIEVLSNGSWRSQSILAPHSQKTRKISGK
jgi:hypothetical protein